MNNPYITTGVRFDPISGNCAISSPFRSKSLEKLVVKSPREWSNKISAGLISGENCPFETGREELDLEEFLSFRREDSIAGQPGWWLRVIPNRFPAFENIINMNQKNKNVGPFQIQQAYGQHYLVIESTGHTDRLSTITPHQIREVLYTWLILPQLIIDHENQKNKIKYVAIYENCGPSAGASQPHPHSNAIGLPFIPKQMETELYRAAKFFKKHNKNCFFCEEVKMETESHDRIIIETPNLMAWCPFVSIKPYEILVGPKYHQASFSQIATYSQDGQPDILTELAYLLQEVLQRMDRCLNTPDYVLYIHTIPINQNDSEFYHWHIEINPITNAIQAGCETGYNTYFNPRAPELAALDLRNI